MVGPGMAVAIGYAHGRADDGALFHDSRVGLCHQPDGRRWRRAGGVCGGGGGLRVRKAGLQGDKIDILLTPVVTILCGVGVAWVVAKPIGTAVSALGQAVMWATEQQPFVMGIVVSVLIGMALTLPISSAAICAALSLRGLAGGAAVAGCCAQMIGFAVISFRENRWGGLMAQGIGTSMLQVSNIVKNPRIWLRPTLASAITGPLPPVCSNCR